MEVDSAERVTGMGVAVGGVRDTEEGRAEVCVARSEAIVKDEAEVVDSGLEEPEVGTVLEVDVTELIAAVGPDAIELDKILLKPALDTVLTLLPVPMLKPLPKPMPTPPLDPVLKVLLVPVFKTLLVPVFKALLVPMLLMLGSLIPVPRLPLVLLIVVPKPNNPAPPSRFKVEPVVAGTEVEVLVTPPKIGPPLEDTLPEPLPPNLIPPAARERTDETVAGIDFVPRPPSVVDGIPKGGPVEDDG